jgi:hypothetical protein
VRLCKRPLPCVEYQMGGDSVPEQELHNALSHTKTTIALGKHRRLPSRASFEVEDGFRIIYLCLRVEHIFPIYLPQSVRTPARNSRLSICSNVFTTRSTCTPHHQVRGNFATNPYGRVTSNCIPSGSRSEKTQHLAGLIPRFPIRHSRSTHTLCSFSYFHLRHHELLTRAQVPAVSSAQSPYYRARSFPTSYNLLPHSQRFLFSTPHPCIPRPRSKPRPLSQSRLTTRSLAYDKSLNHY